MLLNSNKERDLFWDWMTGNYPGIEIEKAIKMLHPDAQKVIRLHYENNIALKDIPSILNKSISTIRNHHSRSVYLLARRFNTGAVEIF